MIQLECKQSGDKMYTRIPALLLTRVLHVLHEENHQPERTENAVLVKVNKLPSLNKLYKRVYNG